MLNAQHFIDVVLLYPKTGMDFGSTVAPPHSLLTIAAPLVKAGYSVKILDQRVQVINKANLTLYVDDKTIVGISSMTGTQVGHALELSQMVRDISNAKIVWGGPHPSVVPEQTVNHPCVDYVVKGEGDYTFQWVVYALSRGQKLSRIIPGSLADIEYLYPTPWELIDVEKYIHPDMYLKGSRVLDIGQTSRGCPFQCGFCSSASLRERKWRSMSITKSVKMIEDAVKRFDLDGIWLRDDEFYIDKQRALAICEAIIPLGIRFYTSGTRVDMFDRFTDVEIKTFKAAGAYTLKFGAESGCQRTLDGMNKGITPDMTLRTNKRCLVHGIKPAYSLIVGYPVETFGEIDQTIDFAYRLKKENSNAQLETMAIYTALPGTPDWKLALANGLKSPKKLEDWADWVFDDYDLDGVRSPWYNKKERIWLGNISYMSILANALENVVGSIRNRFIRRLSQVLTVPISAFYRFRLIRKWYKFAPDLVVVRLLRKWIMY